MQSQRSRNKEIKELKQKGLTYQEIGNKFGLSRQRVHQIISQDIIGRENMGVDIVKEKCIVCEKPISESEARQYTNCCKECARGEIVGGETDYSMKVNPKKFQGREFLKEKVRRRDHYTCQKCGKKWKPGTRRLDVHHKNFMDSQTDAKKYKNNKDMDQLITLCHKCHLNLPEHRKKMSEAQNSIHRLSPVLKSNIFW